MTGDAVVFLGDGFEESEGLLVVDLLRRAGLKTIMASIMEGRDVRSSRGILIQADCLAENVDFEHAGLLVLPGGRLGTKHLSKSDLVRKQCLAFAKDKYVAAICAAPTILADLGLLTKATVHPDFKEAMGPAEITDEPVVVDNNMITGQGLGSTIPFALKLIEIMTDQETADRIRKAICYRG
ncbi:MAG: DJ-1/PfpI family protein [Clostridia bacterium]|nr:DJ-1/PfpI family protein [Clostridia bacterium]